MRGKYKNRFVHTLATIKRERLRSRLANLVEWEPIVAPESGCTAIVGVCSKLPEVLTANLRCLWSSRWPELKRTVAVVDSLKEAFPAQVVEDVAVAFPELRVEFHYYSAEQVSLAESLRLPHIYAWLSWCIALKYTTTSHVLIHDYDALVFGSALAERYQSFVASGAKVQGVAWYNSNGVEMADRLATTFEAFMDTMWLRSSKPIALFNKIRAIGGRSVDFDTTLDHQHRYLSPTERTITPMTLEELVHPSQMLAQYTMFRRSPPGAALPSFSIPMIPYFRYLSGRANAIEQATRALQYGKREDLDFLGDATRINFSKLTAAQVDWVLKNIVQASLALGLKPDPGIYTYGEALYRLIDTPRNDIWRGDFTDGQRAWVNAAKQAC
jgi:hypothetical protein